MIYSYDIECIPNHFSILFVELGQTKIIDEYVRHDIQGNKTKKNEVLKRLKHRLFIIQDNVNDLTALFNFVTAKGRKFFVGYNSTNYDSIMLDYLIEHYREYKSKTVEEITTDLKRVNDIIIKSDLIFFELRKYIGIGKTSFYFNIDIQSLNNIHKLPDRVSLKQVSIYLKWYKIEDYDMPPYTLEEFKDLYPDEDVDDIDKFNNLKSFDRKVHQNHLIEFIEYLFNDVFITDRLLMESMSELESRVAVMSKYGLNTLSSPRSGTAEKIMAKLYSDYTGLQINEFKNQRTYVKHVNLGNIIHHNIQFKSPEFIELLKKISSTIITIGESKFTPTVIYKGKKYQLGLGGLHSVDLGGLFESTEDVYILDADVDSYYPRSIVEYKIKPRHLSDIFINILSTILEERLHYKKIKDKVNAGIYKIVINSVFGKYGYADSFFKDDRAMYQVTVNNQLYLLMLVEDLEMNGFKVISANTDGVTALVPVSKLDIYHAILKDWSKRTKFTLEVNKYIKYVRTSINDYIAKVEKGELYEIKRKGDFDKNKYREVTSGYYYPIVPKALEDYYMDGIPIEQTIRDGTDILDYCMSQKTGSNFVNEEHKIVNGELKVNRLTKTLRFYASIDGSTLLKKDVATGRYTNILAHQRVTLLNKLKDVKDIKEYNIDYNFYIRKAYDMIDKVNNALTAKMKKNVGTLFDNLD